MRAAYRAASAPSIEDLVERHAPLVKRIALHLVARLPASVQAEDLVQAGMIGLIDAARHYDACQGASFETYAGIRIRGAMLDEIRRGDWAPRSVHRKARAVAGAMHELRNRLGREAEDHEVACALGIALADYHAILADSNSVRVLSLEDLAGDEGAPLPEAADPSQGPLQELQAKDFARSLAAALQALPERERLVLSLYYDDELNLKEIGAVLGVGESRVSQLHGQAVIRLQGLLRAWARSED